MAGFRHEKEKYLKATTDKRRSGYYCGSLYVPLESIPSWIEHYTQKFTSLTKLKANNKRSGFLGKFEPNNGLARKVSLWRGDITLLEVDGIVNSATASLSGGNGTGGNSLINQAGGSFLRTECDSFNGCPIGQSKTSGGYQLPAKYVIHTVGPQGIKPELLTSCYQSACKEALWANIRTLAFPCISTGNLGYPNDQAAHIALSEIRKFLEMHSEQFDRIIFVTYKHEDYKTYEEYMQYYFPIQTSTPMKKDKMKRKMSTEDPDIGPYMKIRKRY